MHASGNPPLAQLLARKGKYVHNHLAVELPDGDYRDDVQLATAANNALLWDVTVPEGIEATARSGNITLSGGGFP